MASPLRVRLPILRSALIAATLAPLAIGQAPCNTIALLNQNPGANDAVLALAALPDGSVLAGGYFSSIGGAAATNVAVWNGAVWLPRSLTASSVTALATRANGTPIAGYQAGYFAHPYAGVKQWTAAGWSDVGATLNSTLGGAFVKAVGEFGGEIVAGGTFEFAGGSTVQLGSIARFVTATGQWTPLGNGFTYGIYAASVAALASLPNGDLVAAGTFTASGPFPLSNIARWDGANWSSFANGIGGPVATLLVQPNGDLIAGGRFDAAGSAIVNNIARWNGTSWSALGSGLGGVNDTVTALGTLPSGDLVAATSSIVGGALVGSLLRWSGAGWMPIAINLTGPPNNDGTVKHLAKLPTGELLAGGMFTSANGPAAEHLLTVTSTCRATAPTFGTGCATASGLHILRATAMPWLGTTFRAQGVSLPSPSIVFAITSVAPFAPGTVLLNTLFPQGVAGCSLMALPEYVEVLAANGTADSSLAIPNSPALVGAVYYHQMVPCTLGVGGSIAAITSTNALRLTIGAL